MRLIIAITLSLIQGSYCYGSDLEYMFRISSDHENKVEVSEPMKCSGIYFLGTAAYEKNQGSAQLFEDNQEIAQVIYVTHIAKKEVTRGEISKLKSQALDWLGAVYDKYAEQKVENLPINLGILKLSEILMNCDFWIAKARFQINDARSKAKNLDDYRKLISTNFELPIVKKKFNEFEVQHAVSASKVLVKAIRIWNDIGRMTPYKFKEKLGEKIQN